LEREEDSAIRSTVSPVEKVEAANRVEIRRDGMTEIRTNGRLWAGTKARRGMTVLAVAGALAVALAACGKDDKPVTAANGGQTATTVSVATTVPVATTVAPKPTVATATSATLGTILVDSTGKTLYTFDKDTSTTSACTGGCAATWPALVLPSGTTTPVAGTGITGLTAAARPDDATKMQVDLNGKPLYNYAADTAPGDTKGDGVGGIWHVAKPA
jgi:predicted lipoprotein with Yx(FWY)xxD motif